MTNMPLKIALSKNGVGKQKKKVADGPFLVEFMQEFIFFQFQVILQLYIFSSSHFGCCLAYIISNVLKMLCRQIQKTSSSYVVEHLLILRKPFQRGQCFLTAFPCRTSSSKCYLDYFLKSTTYQLYLLFTRRQDSSIGFGAPVRANMRAGGVIDAAVASSLLETVRNILEIRNFSWILFQLVSLYFKIVISLFNLLLPLISLAKIPSKSGLKVSLSIFRLRVLISFHMALYLNLLVAFQYQLVCQL